LRFEVNNTVTSAPSSATFYKWEGFQSNTALPAGTDTVRSSLYIDPTWANKPVSASMWGTTTNGTDSAWPIIGFSNGYSGSYDYAPGNFVGFRVYDTNTGVWHEVVPGASYFGKTVDLEIAVNQLTGKYEFYLNGNEVYSYYTEGYNTLTNVIFNNLNLKTDNALDNYVVRWTNFYTGTLIHDVTAPVVNITSPVQSIVGGVVTISGTQDESNPDHYYFVVKDHNGNVVAHTTANGSTDGVVYSSLATIADWTWNTKLVNDGTYTIDLEARDTAGNKDSNSIATKVITVDNTAPSVPVNGYPSNIYLNSNVFNYTWDASTDILSPVHYEYLASQDSTTVSGMLVNNVWSSEGPNFVSQKQHDALYAGSSIPSEGTLDGTWYWQVRAVDAAGNASAWSQVWHYTLDTVAPKVTVSNLTTTDTKPTVTGTVNDPNTDVSVDVNGVTYTALVATTANSDGTYNWSAAVTDALALDTYNISATANDKAGNQGTTTGELTIFAALVPPVPPIQSVQLLLGPTATPFTTTPQNTGNTSPTNTGNTDTNQTVAGAQTQTGNDNQNNKDQAVEGASDTKGPWSLWGMAWYWWLVILAVLAAIVWWLVAGYRRNSNES
jgi:hypothetical protein